MRLYIPLGANIDLRNFLRQSGYNFFINYQTNRGSFARRLTSDGYPRFHIYIEKDLEGRNYLNLHLDQKRPSYQGANAHNADYDGEVVARENDRLKKKLYDSIDHEEKVKPQEKESFFGSIKKLFKF